MRTIRRDPQSTGTSSLDNVDQSDRIIIETNRSVIREVPPALNISYIERNEGEPYIHFGYLGGEEESTLSRTYTQEQMHELTQVANVLVLVRLDPDEITGGELVRRNVTAAKDQNIPILIIVDDDYDDDLINELAERIDYDKLFVELQEGSVDETIQKWKEANPNALFR